MSGPEGVQPIAQPRLFPTRLHSVSMPIAALSLLIAPHGLAARALANGNVAAMADAKAVIRRGVELRHDGHMQSDTLDRNRPVQVTVEECDPETIRKAEDCVFLIYEIQ